MAVTNKYITIKTHIEGSPQNSDFEFKTQDLSLFVKHGSNNVLVKSLYLSVDPYQLNRMKKYSSAHNSATAIAPLAPGQVIDAFGLGKVVASEHPNFKKDDLVTGMIAWAEYCTVKGDSLSKLDSMGLPLSYHVGVLGISGLTAYVGFFDVCKPKKGEKVFVSAASGSVGNVVGQYAKLFGCHVVGCAGSKKKVELLKEKLGFDDAFNYKEETDLKSALKRYFPEGIDIYFDNVGAEMLQAAVANMNHFGRVAACGVISEYPDSAGRRAGPSMVDVVFKRITIRGFIVGDHFNMFPEFVSKTSDYLRAGKMKVVEDISRGLESVPAAFVGLFCGDNTGKKIVQVVDD